MSNSTTRPAIPEEIKRAVRKRCGYGCVICGVPLYEYDHLIGWAETQQHVEQEITLLCDRHHREKTNGLLPASKVAADNANPFNLRTGVSPPYHLHFQGATECAVNLGSNIFWAANQGDGTLLVPVWIDGVPLIAFRFVDQHLLLTVHIFDEFNNLILHVKDNQLVFAPTPWDIEFVGKRITLREAARKILVEIEFDPPNKVTIPRARLLLNGAQVFVRPTEVVVPAGASRLTLQECINAANAAVVIGQRPRGVMSLWHRPHVPRYATVNTDQDVWLTEMFGGTVQESGSSSGSA